MEPDRTDNLKAKHAALEDEIEKEVKRPRPDGFLLASLKRQKLRLKDELEREKTA